MTIEEAIKSNEYLELSYRDRLHRLTSEEAKKVCLQIATNYHQQAEWLKELSRARTLLKSTHELLETAWKSPYVLNALSIAVHYDEVDCDGSCLKEDIENYFDEYGGGGTAECDAQFGWRDNKEHVIKSWNYRSDDDVVDNKKNKTREARWIINSDGYYPYCSACMTEPQNGEMADYCPNCGAKMKK